MNRLIGQKLGLTVDIGDYAFDGLGTALQVNQIDVAIAAISVTDEREQFVDFSHIYFISEDAVLAAAGSQITVNTADELALYRIGVQSGTIYEEFVRTELIETGVDAILAGGLDPDNVTGPALSTLGDIITFFWLFVAAHAILNLGVVF